MLCYVRSVPLTSSYEPRSYRGRQFTLNVRTYDLLNWVLKTYVYDVLCLFIAMYLSCYVRFHVSQDRLPLFPLARNDNLIDKYWLVSGTDSSRISLEDWINYQISPLVKYHATVISVSAAWTALCINVPHIFLFYLHIITTNSSQLTVLLFCCKC